MNYEQMLSTSEDMPEAAFDDEALGREVMRRVMDFHGGTWRDWQDADPREEAIADALAIAYGAELIRVLSAPPVLRLRTDG